MYGCGDACVVYGFNFGDRNSKFDSDWLYENYPKVECYAVDIVRNYLGEPIYGVVCDFDRNTGQAIGPSNKEKEIVKSLYNKYIQYLKEKNISILDNVELGYHLAVYGWDEEEHKIITLDKK